MLELYHAGVTTCSLKARLCLKEKRLQYVSHFVSLQRFEQHASEYLALNPNGVVPTLVHNGVPIYESTVINEYIDEAFPEIPLRPTNPQERARMRIWFRLADEAFTPNQILNYSGRIKHRADSQIIKPLSDDALDAELSRTPLPERRALLEKINRGSGISEQEVDLARQKAVTIVDRAEKDLQRYAYLAGESYTLADVNMIPFIDRYKNRVIGEYVTPERTPKLCDWYRRVMARPAVMAAFAPSNETRDPGRN